MFPLLILLVILALILGGFFVFALKVAVVIAIVLVALSLVGVTSLRGRRSAFRA